MKADTQICTILLVALEVIVYVFSAVQVMKPYIEVNSIINYSYPNP